MRVVGIYKGGEFRFTFAINPNYPHEPPKVRCVQKVRSIVGEGQAEDW